MNVILYIFASTGVIALVVILALAAEIRYCRCEQRNAKIGLIRVYPRYDVYSHYYECRVCGRHYIDWRTMANVASNERGGLADAEEKGAIYE